MSDPVKKKDPPSAGAEKFIVRLPDGMRTRIADAAATNNRTMNAEIVARLKASFEPAAQRPDRAQELRVEQWANEDRLQALQGQRQVLQMTVELLTQRLEAQRAAKRAQEVRATQAKLDTAQAELAALEDRRAALMEQGRRLQALYDEASQPMRESALRAAELVAQRDVSEAEKERQARLAALLELAPTSAELAAAAKVLGAREAERIAKIANGRTKKRP